MQYFTHSLQMYSEDWSFLIKFSGCINADVLYFLLRPPKNCCNLQVCLNFISSNKFFWRLLEIFNCKNESYTHFGVNVTAVILFVIASLNGNCGGIFESLSSPARKPCQPCKYYIRCSENITRIWNSKVQSITPTALQISLKPQV